MASLARSKRDKGNARLTTAVTANRANLPIVIDSHRLLAETFLRHAEWLDQLDSTNNRALARVADPTTETPFLIGSDVQTAGRGRGANRWWGASGAIMFSLGVDMSSLELPAMAWPRFSLVTGLAVAEMLKASLPTAHIGLKWPNDVWINGRKASGILIEQSERLPDRLVIGIGVNVNNSFADAPPELREIATSMTDAAAGLHFERTEVLIDLLTRWRLLIQRLANQEMNLAEQWSHSCVLTGHPITLTSGNLELTGICAGVDEDGALLLRTEFTLERCYAGTVRRLD